MRMQLAGGLLSGRSNVLCTRSPMQREDETLRTECQHYNRQRRQGATDPGRNGRRSRVSRSFAVSDCRSRLLSPAFRQIWMLRLSTRESNCSRLELETKHGVASKAKQTDTNGRVIRAAERTRPD